MFVKILFFLFNNYSNKTSTKESDNELSVDDRLALAQQYVEKLSTKSNVLLRAVNAAITAVKNSEEMKIKSEEGKSKKTKKN